MKLHYSQTEYSVRKSRRSVLLPYEITLLSNALAKRENKDEVLLPYEITLLSNFIDGYSGYLSVLLPYEITLLSNLKFMWQRVPCSLLNRAISYAVF